MKFVFRVDASLQIGTGHVMRCLTLGEELKRRGHNCTFICRAHKGNLGNHITDRGFAVVLLGSLDVGETSAQDYSPPEYCSWLGVTWEQDAEETVRALDKLQPNWIIVDHYAVDASWEKRVVSSVERLMVIDDLANRKHECDLLLDQNLGRANADYDPWLRKCCTRLIGPEYALLRPEFARLRGQSLARRKNPELKRVLISLGGVDRDNITGQVLAAVAESNLPEQVELDVVLGSSAPFAIGVRAQTALLPFRASVTVDASDMAERMCQADLSIGAAGCTSWERSCLGLPTLLVVAAPNQRSIAEALASEGAAQILEIAGGWRNEFPRIFSGVCLPRTLQEMSDSAARLTSGEGTICVANAISDFRGKHQ